MSTAETFIQEIIDTHRSDKDGETLVEDLARHYLIQPDHLKTQMIKIFEDWIKHGDTMTADWGIYLCRRLHLTQEIPLLEMKLKEIKEGKSNLPRYFEQFLEPTIKALYREN